MRVMLLSPTQHAHTTIAEIVKEEVSLLQGRKITSLLSAAVFAVGARVASLACGALWLLVEVPCFIPRLVFVAAGLLLSSSSSFATTLWRVVKVYSLVIRMTVLQGLSFGCAAVLPELLYPKLQIHKTLFSLHVQALLETLPDFPTIDQSMYSNIQEGFLDPMGKLWSKLKLKSNLFRDLLQEKLFHLYEKQPALAADLLDVESVTFRRLFCRVACDTMAKALNSSSDTEALKDLCPFTYSMMYSDLTREKRTEIATVRPDLMAQLENGEPYVHAMSYRYIHPHDKQLSMSLLDSMIKASTLLVEKNMYTTEEIQSYEAYRPAVLIGLYQFIQSAKVVDSQFVVTLKDGEQISIADDTRFFETRKALIELHVMICQLSDAQKEELYKQLSFKGDSTDELVMNCFRKLGNLETDVIQTRVISSNNLSEKDTTKWETALFL